MIFPIDRVALLGQTSQQLRGALAVLCPGAAVLANQRGGKQKTEIFGCLCELLEQRHERFEEQKRRIAQRIVRRISRKERLHLAGKLRQYSSSKSLVSVRLQVCAARRNSSSVDKRLSPG